MYASVNLEKYSENIRKTEVLAAGIPDKGITAILKGMMQRPSRVAVMEEGKVPLLWILGALDNFINLQQVREGITLPLNARVAILYNSGHMGFIEEESISLQLLEDFIKGK